MTKQPQASSVSRFAAALVLVILGTQTAFTQRQQLPIAKAGPRMIYVNLGADLPSAAKPAKKAVAYTIGRRKGSTGTFQTLASVAAPLTIDEFRSRLEAADGLMPEPIALSRIPVKQLWDKIHRYGRLDSLGFWAGVLPVRVACGAMFVDTSASRGVSYEYSVSLTDSRGTNLLTLRSAPVSYPGSPRFGPLHVVESNATASQITVRWVIDAGTRPVSYSVLREEGFQSTFQPVEVSRVILSQQHATFIVVQDTLVQPHQVYRYYLVPLDYYGNPGSPSDTAMVGSYTMLSAPLPEFFTATSSDSLGGIELSWHLRNSQFVRSIQVFRSEQFDSGFVQLAEIPATDSSFLDLRVTPMIKYVYYLNLVGPLGKTSPPSIKIFGIFETAAPPVPPAGLQAEQTKAGVRLSWIRNDEYLKGFYVYRSDGLSDSLRVISPLIPAADSTVVYLDSTADGNTGRHEYLYAVRSENTSHVLSAFSDTVAVTASAGRIPAPHNLNVYAEGSSAVLTWEDLYATYSIDRYGVYRRQLAKNRKTWSRFQALSDSIPPQQNNFTDTTIVPGTTYEYAVKAIAFVGENSPLSPPVRVRSEMPPPPTPAGLTAIAARGRVVLHWSGVEQPDIVRYHLYRYTRGRKPARIASIRAADEPEFTDKAVRKGALLFYYVTSVNRYGVESAHSKEVSIRP